ncbi:MAG: PEGA domain-containing protein [Proteobacteria bacterium]|nr:PEGA domain-containing protein [Pseudomonadota bacterium]
MDTWRAELLDVAEDKVVALDCCDDVLALLDEMLRFEADARPTAAEVARRAQRLVDGIVGPGLRSVARALVPRLIDERRDRMTRSLGAAAGLIDRDFELEAVTLEPTRRTRELIEQEPPQPAPSRWPLVLAVLGIGIGGVLVGKLAFAPDPIEEPVEVAAPEPVEEPIVEEPIVEEPIVEEPIEEPTVPEPAVVEAAPRDPVDAPEPPPAELHAVRINSQPWGAEVLVDGKRIGTTPIMSAGLAAGARSVTLRLGDASVTGSFVVGPDRPDKLTWTVGEPSWQLDYSSP